QPGEGPVAAISSVDTPTTAAAPGVRNPATSPMPLRMAMAPRAAEAAVGSAVCTRYAPPTLAAAPPAKARSSNRPAAGQPSGNVEKNRCRPSLLVAGPVTVG